MTTYTEFEAKFYFIEKAPYRERLKTIRAQLVEPERLFRRSIYASSSKSQINGSYARVRDEGNAITMSIKTEGTNVSSMDAQKEICLRVDSFEIANDFLQNLYLQQKAYQETLRETWELDGAEITIDTWPGLPPYTEVEAHDEATVYAVAKKLAVDGLKQTFKGVAHLYCEVYDVDEETVNNNTPRIVFEELPVWTARKRDSSLRSE